MTVFCSAVFISTSPLSIVLFYNLSIFRTKSPNLLIQSFSTRFLFFKVPHGTVLSERYVIYRSFGLNSTTLSSVFRSLTLRWNEELAMNLPKLPSWNSEVCNLNLQTCMFLQCTKILKFRNCVFKFNKDN